MLGGWGEGGHLPLPRPSLQPTLMSNGKIRWHCKLKVPEWNTNFITRQHIFIFENSKIKKATQNFVFDWVRDFCVWGHGHGQTIMRGSPRGWRRFIHPLAALGVLVVDIVPPITAGRSGRAPAAGRARGSTGATLLSLLDAGVRPSVARHRASRQLNVAGDAASGSGSAPPGGFSLLIENSGMTCELIGCGTWSIVCSW